MTNSEILELFRERRDDWPDHVALVSVAREIERKARASERKACAAICRKILRRHHDRVVQGTAASHPLIPAVLEFVAQEIVKQKK